MARRALQDFENKKNSRDRRVLFEKISRPGRIVEQLLVSLIVVAEEADSNLLDHDLVRALVNPTDPRIHQMTRRPRLEAITTRAENLDRPVSSLKRSIRGEILRLCDHHISLIPQLPIPGARITPLLQQGSLVDQVLRSLQTRRHIPNMPLHKLVLTNLLPMLDPLLRIRDRLFDTVLDHPKTASRDTQPTTHQPRVGDAQALPQRSHEVLLRNPAIIQEDRPGVRGGHPKLVLLLLARIPLKSLLNNKRAHPIPLPLRVSENHSHISNTTIRNPRLATIQKIVASPILKGCPKRRRIASRRRLRQAKTHRLLSPRGRRKVALLQLLARPFLNRHLAKRHVTGEKSSNTRTLPADPLKRQRIG